MGLTQNIFQLLLGFFASLLLLPPPPLHCCSVQAIFSSDILIQPQNPDSHYSLHVSDLLISSCPFHQPVLPEMPFTANIVSPLSVHLSGGGGGFRPTRPVAFFFGTSLSPQAVPLEIPIKEVIEERNSLRFGSHKRRFAVNLLFPFPLVGACAGGVPEQIPRPRLPAEPQVNLPAPAWREFSPIGLRGEPSTPRVSLGGKKKKKS